MCEIANKIKNRRLELDLTLEEVAQAVGVGRSTVQRWESGMIKNMGRDKIAALARVLQISPVELVPGDVQKSHHVERYTDPEDIEILEALHQKPGLPLLFDRTRNTSHEDVQKILKVIDAMFPEDDS